MITAFIDPVHGAAFTAGLLPILPALPCPTCGGKRWLRAPAPYDEVLPGRSCPDCTDGVWTPPEHPVPIGVTSAEPNRKVHPMAWRDDEGWWLYEPTERRRAAIVLSSVIGEATLRKVPVFKCHPVSNEHLDEYGHIEHICASIGHVPMSPGSVRDTLYYEPTEDSGALDISSALPFLPGLKPGDTVYLLDGFTESVVCDGGRCGLSHRGCYPGDQAWCSSCDQMIPTERNGRFVTHWHRPMRRPCPFPVAAPDHPCVQP